VSAAVCLLACLTLSAVTFAQQELPLGAGETGAIYEKLRQSPLTGDQKRQVHQAIEARDYKTAEVILVRAIDANQKSAELLTLSAGVFLLDKNPLNTAIALKKAERIQPLGAADRFSLAMAYTAMEKRDWARQELDRLTAAEPGNTLYTYWLARLDYDDQHFESAVGRLRRVTSVSPAFTKAWDNLGLSLEGMGELDQAVASYREAVRQNRDARAPSPWPPLNLGTLLMKMGDLKGAEECLLEAVRFDAKLAKAHYQLGMNLHKQKRDAEAIPELRHAAELDPSDPEPFYTLGRIYEGQGESDASADAFRQFELLKKKQRAR
jgi:tetratricopeptide (TPR) repeat protein